MDHFWENNSRLILQKSDFFKQDFHYEENILWTFQIDASQLGCLILKNVKGKWILLRGELAGTPETTQGWSPDLRRKSDFFKQDFHYEENILWKFQIDASQLGCLILKNVKGKWILLRGELARTPQTTQGWSQDLRQKSDFFKPSKTLALRAFSIFDFMELLKFEQQKWITNN